MKREGRQLVTFTADAETIDAMEAVWRGGGYANRAAWIEETVKLRLFGPAPDDAEQDQGEDGKDTE